MSRNGNNADRPLSEKDVARWAFKGHPLNPKAHSHPSAKPQRPTKSPAAVRPAPPLKRGEMVPKAGLEPAHLSAQASETCVSTNSTTWARRSPQNASEGREDSGRCDSAQEN